MIRERLTYANVMSTIAVFAILGGGSFAVAALSGQEKKVVKRIAKKQANKRITKRAPGLSVASAQNAVNAQNAVSAQDAAASQNAHRLANVTVEREDFQVTDGAVVSRVASCPAGQQAISGGVGANVGEAHVADSHPGDGIGVPPPDDGQGFGGWLGSVTNPAGGFAGSVSASVWVVCAG